MLRALLCGVTSTVLFTGTALAGEFTITGTISRVNAASLLITVTDNKGKNHTLPIAAALKLVGVDGWDGGRGKDVKALKKILADSGFQVGATVAVRVSKSGSRLVATEIRLGRGRSARRMPLPEGVKAHLKKQFPEATPVEVRLEGNHHRVRLRFKNGRSIDVFYRNMKKRRTAASPQANPTLFLQGDAFWLWPAGRGYAVGQFSITRQNPDGSFSGQYTDFQNYDSGTITGTLSGDQMTFAGVIGAKALHFDGTVTSNVGPDAVDTVQGTLRNGMDSLAVTGHDGFIR